MLDVDGIIHEINSRYFGSSQKALIVAFKDALKKYRALREKSDFASPK